MLYGFRKLISNGQKQFYYLDPQTGISQIGVFPINKKGELVYFNGKGTLTREKFITWNGNLYYLKANGKVCQSNWTAVRTGGNCNVYIHCDPQTGVVSQGQTTFVRDGELCTMYLDKNAANGYRIGAIKTNNKLYYYSPFKGDQGKMVTREGYITQKKAVNKQSKKVYWCTGSSGELKTRGTISVPNTSIKIKVQNNGELDIASASRLMSGDSKRTQVIKYALQQLFKPYGHPSINRLFQWELPAIRGWNCSGFVLRIYAEIERTTDPIGPARSGTDSFVRIRS